MKKLAFLLLLMPTHVYAIRIIPIQGDVNAVGPLTDSELRASPVPVTLNAGTSTIGNVDQGLGGSSAWKTDGSSFVQPVSGSFFQATQPVSGAFFQSTQPVSAASLPLPSGASTSALQTSGNSSLSSIDSKIPGSPSQDRTTAASPSSVRLSDGAAFYKGTTPADTQPVSGPLTDTQLRATPVSVSGTISLSGTSQVVGNVASGAADSGGPVKTGAVYNSTLPGPASGQRIDAQANAFGELSIRPRNKFTHVTGNTTVTIKNSAGVLAGICFGVVSTQSTIVVYNNTTASGTVFTSIDFGSTINLGFCSQIDAEMSTGITIVTGGNVSNDITVLYQ